MSRRHRAGELEFHPAKAFAAAHGQEIQRVGKLGWLFLAWTGGEGRGLQFPPGELGGSGGDFQFDDGVVQFPAIKAMDGLHGELQPAIAAAGDGGAITAFGAFKLVGPAHERQC